MAALALVRAPAGRDILPGAEVPVSVYPTLWAVPPEEVALLADEPRANRAAERGLGDDHGPAAGLERSSSPAT